MKKISLRTLRIGVAIGVIFTVVISFFDFRDALPAAVKNAITSVQFIPSVMAFFGGVTCVAAFIVILAVSALVGRVYCSTLCPLGIFQDIVSRLAKMFRKKKSVLRFAPARNFLRYGFLAALLMGCCLGFGGLVTTLLDPYSNFGRICTVIFRPILIFLNDIATAIAQYYRISNGADFFTDVQIPIFGIGVILPVLFFLTLVVWLSARHGRLYCNTICPVGTLLGVASRFAVFRLAIDRSVCKKCGDCMRVCRSQCIDLKKQEIDFSRCVGCYDCVSVCDVHGLKYHFLGRQKSGAAPQKNVKAPPPSPKMDSSRRAFIQSNVAGALTLFGSVPLFSALLGKIPATSVGAKTREANKDDMRDDAYDGLCDIVSPPGASNIARFVDKCTACHLCVSACPSHVLEPTLLGYGTVKGMMKPRLNYTKSFCNFDCTVCSEVCPDGAILPIAKDAKRRTRIGVAVVARSKCIVRTDDTACGACAEHCPTAALQMEVRPSAEFPQPFVDPAICIGCGACEYACPAKPVKAVIVHGVHEHETSEALIQEKVADPNAGADFAF